MTLAVHPARSRAPERTLVAQAGAVWIWPGIALTLRRGAEILPAEAQAIRFWITRLHGPEALDREILPAIACAARCLMQGNEPAAQRALDALGLTQISEDGALLMRVVADALGIACPDLPLRAGPRIWAERDIAFHLPLFKLHVETARALAKGVMPFDTLKHPHWPAGTPERRGGQFRPTHGEEASVVPVAARGSGKPPPRRPSGPRGKSVAPNRSGSSRPSQGRSSAQEPSGSSPDDLPPWEVTSRPRRATGPIQGPRDLPPIKVEPNQAPGIGHNGGPPLEEPPEIPKGPISIKLRNVFVKLAVRWLLEAAKVSDPELEAYLLALNASEWAVKQCWPYIEAYFTRPKTLEELQRDAKTKLPGYDIHHRVEKDQARKEGYPKSMWDGPQNKVRVPTLKHWEITGWYMTKNNKYGGLSPRDYLRGKSWDEKVRVGLEALRRFGVLKP
ncbi:MAG TPA: hypothetical protein VKV77_08300 [Methylovirgula sp.]|nr:hypothetical protein [Methylovirgula sp.]